MSSDTITAEAGEKIGLVERLFDTPVLLLEGAVMYARTLAQTAPGSSLAAIKQQIWRHPGMEDLEAYRSTQRLVVASNNLDGDIKEGIMSFMQKRKPKWRPPTPQNPLMQAVDQEFGNEARGMSRL
jgi:enoyl-CoA hydratase/carnithine racemase